MTHESSSLAITISESAFDEFEHDEHVKFTPEHRRRTVEALQQFASECERHARLVEAERRRIAREKRPLEKLDKYLKKAIGVVEEIQPEHPKASTNRLADTQTARWRTSLMDLQKSCNLRKRRRATLPDYPVRWKLLRSLERVFKDAGGTSTGVHHGRRPRHGPFPNFVDFAIRHLPRPIRPGSLTSEWEKIYSARKKGDFQLSISNPTLFDLTFTSRRVKTRSANAASKSRNK
jgi:hypothetical protein